MSETLSAWVLFGGYAVLVVVIAVRSRLKARSMQSFSVGTRTLPPSLIGLSLAANLTSAATFVINPGLIYLYGWSGILGYGVAAPLGIFLGLIVFSKSFRRIGDRFTVLTVPQWIGERYGSVGLRVWFAVLSLLQVTFLVLIVVGLAIVLRSTLQIPIEAALAMTVLFTFAYIVLGGASAHILTNTLQAGIMILVAFILLGSGMQYLGPGFFSRLAEVGPHYATLTNPGSLLFRDLFEVFAANFFIGVAIIMQPHVVSKALYLRTEADVNRYLGTAIVVQTLFFAVLLTGIYARFTLGDSVPTPDAVIATYIVTEFPPFVRAVIGLGVLAAGFSTMEGILVALSSIVANDFLRHVLPRHLTETERWEKVSLRAARGFLLLLAPVTFALSYYQALHPSLSVAMFAQNGVYGLFAATFAPVCFGIFTHRRLPSWAFAASCVALVVHFGMKYAAITQYSNNPAVPATFALGASVIVMAVGAALNRKTHDRD